MKDQEPTMTLVEAVRSRRSVRGYLNKAVSDADMHAIFSLAQEAPSNCNVMPWKVYVASGEKKSQISREIVEAAQQQQVQEKDYSAMPKFEGEYRRRQVDCAVELYNNMGIARDDKEGRIRAVMRNYELFDAPHIAFIGMDKSFDVPVAVDVGMYAQNLMLAMTAYGVSSCAMGSMRHYPDVPKNIFNIPENVGVLFGLCFGYEDVAVAANKTRIEKDKIDQSVVFI